MAQTLKEDLIAQFRGYLDEVEETPETAHGDNAFSLFAELSGLKTEVKRESRQVKEALDEFRSVFATLQSDHETLSRELEQRRAAEKTLRRETLRPLLLQLLELRDRLEAGLASGTVPKSSLLTRFCHRQDELLAALREGQRMSLRRLDRILGDYGVRPMDSLNQPHDPHTMRVVDVESRTDRAQGTVTGELRKGFYWDEELLRPAEVKVNKRDQSHE